MNENKTKRIGIDARFYGPKNKGLGRYAKEVVDGVIKADPVNEYVVFLRRDNFGEFIPPRPGVKKVLADIRWYTLAEQLLMPIILWREKLDLVHFQHFNVPALYPGKFVVTIHDLILTKHPTQRASTLSPLLYRAKNFAYRFVIASALRRAVKVIAISQFTKDDIVSQFGISADKIKVIYEGVADSLVKDKKADDKQILLGYNIHRPYLLYVGNAYPHKNLELLIDIFSKVKEKINDISLVLVGKEDYFYRNLKSYAENKIFRNSIIFPGFVPDKDLGSFFRQAEAYVFPSLYEGFGLPPLEAMQIGCPVVCSNSSCLPEILGEAAEYFDPQNGSDMSDKILGVLGDESRRNSLRELGFKQTALYSWRDCAAKTVEVYLDV